MDWSTGCILARKKPVKRFRYNEKTDMKTNVIQLEPHDDVVSIKDKMTWHPCRRMILVWPKRGRILNSELELELLHRAAESLGAELVLVTHHAVVREWAEGIHVPAFGSIPAAEKYRNNAAGIKTTEKHLPIGRGAVEDKKPDIPLKRNKKTANPIVRGLSILVSGAAVLALLFTILPSATVTIYPVATEQETTINIKASEVFSGVNPSGSIPAGTDTVELSGELSRPSSGKTLIPTQKATGTVTFTNLTSSDLTIPAGSILLTNTENGAGFTLKEEVALPAGVGETADGAVEALSAGVEGNIETGMITAVSGTLGSMVSVENLEPFSGGEGIETASPNEEDYAFLKTKLLQELKDQSVLVFYANLEQGNELIEESITIGEILVEEQANPIGEPADEARLSLTVRFTALTYRNSDLQSICRLVLESSQPEGMVAASDEISITREGAVEQDLPGQASWTIRASRLLVPGWDAQATAQLIAGQKTTYAQSYLAGLFPQTQPAEVKLIFKWWPWMPYLPTQIHFIIGGSS